MKKSVAITLTLTSVILMITNIILAIVFHGDNGSNIFTTISGWISGIATIVLGIIALRIDAQYKKENDNYLSKQDELVWKNEKRSAIELYRAQVIKCYDKFLSYNYADLLYQLLSNQEKPESPIYSIALINKIRAEKHTWFFSLSICKYYFQFKSELFEAYCKYLDLLIEMTNNYDEMVFNKQYDKAENLQKLYIEVINLFNIHISEINVFLSTTLFSKNKNELEKKLNEMRQQQLDWWDSIKTTID